MNQIIEGEVRVGSQVTVQKPSRSALFTTVKREVKFIFGEMAYVQDCGWFTI